MVFAESLKRSVKGEHGQRSSVSRSYYYAFHKASSYLNSLPDIPSLDSTDSHEVIIRTLKARPDLREKEIGKILKRMKDRRVKADYRDIYPGNLESDVDMNISEAKEIEAKIESLIRAT